MGPRRPLARVHLARLLLLNAFLRGGPRRGHLLRARPTERELFPCAARRRVATAAATVAAAADGDPARSGPQPCVPPPSASARVRVLDGAGNVLVDTGPERVELHAARPAALRRSTRARCGAVAVQALPEGDPRRAPGRQGPRRRRRCYTRRLRTSAASSLRRRALRAGGAPAVRGAVYVARTTYRCSCRLYYVRNALVKVAFISRSRWRRWSRSSSASPSRPAQPAHRDRRAHRRGRAGRRAQPPAAATTEAAGTSTRWPAPSTRLARTSPDSPPTCRTSSRRPSRRCAARRSCCATARRRPHGASTASSATSSPTRRLSRARLAAAGLSRVGPTPEKPRVVDYRALCAGGRPLPRRRARAGEPRVGGDPEAGRCARAGETALANLVDNALRFSPEAPRWWCASRATPTPSTHRVEDKRLRRDGANLPRVWDRFHHRRADGGTDLGLSIVPRRGRGAWWHRRGDVEAGRGATFWFTLPDGWRRGHRRARAAHHGDERERTITIQGHAPTPRLGYRTDGA